MVSNGGAKLYYLHKPALRADEESPEPSHVRMRISNKPMPLFDALASSARNIPETAGMRSQLGCKVDKFRIRASSALDDAVKLHAKRFYNGFYKYEDPGEAEQNRQIGLLTIAIHLSKNVEQMWSSLAARADAGSSALFETTLDHISDFLGPDYYSKSHGQIRLGLFEFENLMNGCLKVLDLEERILTMQTIIEANIPRLVELTKVHFERLQQQ